MANKRSNFICPKCKNHGFLHKRAVRSKVQIPKNICTLSDAFNHAAKSFLRMHEDVIRFPPSPELDKQLSQFQIKQAYNEFTKFSLHSADEIRAVESKQLNLLLKRRLKNEAKEKNRNREKDPHIHIRLPENTGQITKLSVLWLYGAIVYTALRDLIQVYQFSEEDNKWFASVVYSYFNFLVSTDDRKFVSPFRWLKILKDVEDHGFNAAASRNYVEGTFCKRCTNIKKEKFVRMEITGINSDERRCSKCGGTEGIKRSVTSKYISKVVKEVKQRIRGFRKNLPSYLKFMDWFAADIRNDPDMRELFQKYFNKYESEASNSLFHRVEHYFMAHYDASKNSKRTWCSLSNNYIYAIEIDDPNYKKLIKDLLDSYEIHDDIKCEGLIIELRQKLGELNYPNDMIFQKIGMDGELMHILQPTSDISSNS